MTDDTAATRRAERGLADIDRRAAAQYAAAREYARILATLNAATA